MDLKITKIKIGDYRTNCYVVSNQKGEAFIVDPGSEAELIIGELVSKNLTPKFILLTHGHFDHVLAVDKIKEIYPKIDVFIHEKDIFLLKDMMEQGIFVGKVLHFFKSEVIGIKDDDVIRFDEDNIHVIATPGHTPGGCCFLLNNNLFSGDTLFYHTCGRIDLPYSNQREMEKSLALLSNLDKKIVVYPGHGRETSIGEEINRFKEYF